MNDAWLTVRYRGESRLDPFEPDDGLQQWAATLTEYRWAEPESLDEEEPVSADLLRAEALVYDLRRLGQNGISPFDAMDAHSADTLSVYEHLLHRRPEVGRLVVVTDVAPVAAGGAALVDRYGSVLLDDLDLTFSPDAQVVLATPDEATVYLRESGYVHVARAMWVKRAGEARAG